ncbi:MAG TPA: outer membrane beta-barrel protein [Xanthobacteraceae bacterium]
MNKLVLVAIAMSVAGSANAADQAPAYKAPPRAKAPATYNWSGPYLGGNAGGIWSNTGADSVSFTTAGVDFAGRQAVGQFPRFDLGAHGFAGGGQIGYNWQFAANGVAGIEADLASTGLNTTDTRVFAATHFVGDGPIEANTEAATQKLGWLATVRGRLGVTILDNRLFAFATGGLAYGGVDDSVLTIGVPNGAAGILVSASSNTSRTGWTIGGGAEYAFLNNWSAKLEYLYYDLGFQTLTLNFAAVPGDAGNTASYRFHDSGNLVRFGLNYHL